LGWSILGLASDGSFVDADRSLKADAAAICRKLVECVVLQIYLASRAGIGRSDWLHAVIGCTIFFLEFRIGSPEVLLKLWTYIDNEHCFYKSCCKELPHGVGSADPFMRDRGQWPTLAIFSINLSLAN